MDLDDVADSLKLFERGVAQLERLAIALKGIKRADTGTWFTVTSGDKPWWIDVEWLGCAFRIVCRLQLIGDDGQRKKEAATWIAFGLSCEPGSSDWRELNFGVVRSTGVKINEKQIMAVEGDAISIFFALINYPPA